MEPYRTFARTGADHDRTDIRVVIAIILNSIGSQDVKSGRQGVGEGCGGRDYGRGKHILRGMTGARIDEVTVAATLEVKRLGA